MRAVFFTLAACLATLAGTVAAAEAITVEQAKEIALAQAGGGGTVVETDIDNHRSGVTYEFEIHTPDAEFEMEIDGATGSVIEFSREQVRLPRNGAARLTAEAAQELAVKAAGGGAVSRYRIDRDDGRLVHEITIFKDDKRYRLEIDDASGNVAELSIKPL